MRHDQDTRNFGFSGTINTLSAVRHKHHFYLTDSFCIFKKIQQAVMALFQIDAHKIRIMKMK